MIKFEMNGYKFIVVPERQQIMMEGGPCRVHPYCRGRGCALVNFYYFSEIENGDGRLFPYETQKELYRDALNKYKKLKAFA